jgi:hypothetical protein
MIKGCFRGVASFSRLRQSCAIRNPHATTAVVVISTTNSRVIVRAEESEVRS